MSRGGPDTWEGTHVSESTATTPSTGSETATEASGTSTATKQRRGSGLSGMLLPELKQMAGGLGIKGAGGMRKSQLVDAIKAAQSGGQSGGASGASQPTSQPSGRTDRAEKPET